MVNDEVLHFCAKDCDNVLLIDYTSPRQQLHLYHDITLTTEIQRQIGRRVDGRKCLNDRDIRLFPSIR